MARIQDPAPLATAPGTAAEVAAAEDPNR
ncbi:hypothetical protein A2U01_0109084, partial [Trifolium medium]|nr:hypothetical protein [Trifolium medium]